MFLGDGYGATSVEGVAKQAGISKRTFYHRFRGKEALFEAVVRRIVESWAPPRDSELVDAGDHAEELRAIAGYMLQVALTPQALALHRLMIAEAQRFPALARILHEYGMARGIETLAAQIEQWIAAGRIRAVDARFAAEQFIMMVVSAPRRRALGLGTPLSTADLATWVDRTVELFLQGCARP